MLHDHVSDHFTRLRPITGASAPVCRNRPLQDYVGLKARGRASGGTSFLVLLLVGKLPSFSFPVPSCCFIRRVRYY